MPHIDAYPTVSDAAAQAYADLICLRCWKLNWSLDRSYPFPLFYLKRYPPHKIHSCINPMMIKGHCAFHGPIVSKLNEGGDINVLPLRNACLGRECLAFIQTRPQEFVWGASSSRLGTCWDVQAACCVGIHIVSCPYARSMPAIRCMSKKSRGIIEIIIRPGPQNGNLVVIIGWVSCTGRSIHVQSKSPIYHECTDINTLMSYTEFCMAINLPKMKG